MEELSNEELATRLEDVLRGDNSDVVKEAAHRLRQFDVQRLLLATEAVDAVTRSTLIDKETAALVEPLIMASVLKNQSSSRMSSLAGKILAGKDYVHGDVMSLAACVLSQDETRGQS